MPTWSDILKEKDKTGKAKEIAKWLSNNRLFKTHNRKISREQLEAKGLKNRLFKRICGLFWRIREVPKLAGQGAFHSLPAFKGLSGAELIMARAKKS